jgi:hypothetical protein
MIERQGHERVQGPLATIWMTDAHRGHGKRMVVRADEKLSAFLELAIRVTLPTKPNGLPHQRNSLLFARDNNVGGVKGLVVRS